MTQYAPRTKVLITLGVAWERTVASKQTLFPVWGDKEDRRPRKGVPEEGEYTLRATKGVNMHPFPKLVITKEDGTPYLEEEEVKLSLVSANDKMVPNIGSCNSCDGTPILSESKQFQLYKSRGGTCAKIRGGVLEFSKVQIGCCSGNRGHGASFCLKAEFVSENSPLKGKVVYSLPIDVGAKGPFAKVFVREASKNSSEVVPSTPVPVVEPNNQLIKYSMPTGATYPGAEDMVNLLHKLNLSQYVDLFVEQEVDIQAFLQLTDDDLSKIGITKVGPKVKILKEIARIRGEDSTAALASSSIAEMPPPPTPTPAALPPIESLSSTYYSNNTPNILAEDDVPAKRRKLMESFASGNSLADMEFDKNLSIYLYLSNVVASNNILKKTLFMVKTELNKLDTDSVVQQIQQQLISELTRKGKVVIHENRAQLMLMMSPDKNGDWVARAANTDNVWNFKRGDYIKIDNHHNVDIGIQVRYYYVSDKNVYTGKSEKSFIEDVRSPKKYPTVFPGGSLEIGIDDNGNGRLALAADLEFEPTETFAVTKNGKLTSTPVNDPNIYTETCNFSFKRSKNINMKKAESFDDFQKEIFLSRCLEPGFF